MKLLREHYTVLACDNILLRPMSEGDWELLLKWNNDVEVLYFSEGDEIGNYELKDLQGIYRSISQNAYCFIIEYNGYPVGECWLQKLNLQRLIDKFPDFDCCRIDISIGEKDFWSKGIGTKVEMILSKFGFENEQTDIIFGCDIADYNTRSSKAFSKAGFEIFETVEQPEGKKAKFTYDMILKKERYWQLKKQGYYQQFIQD